jgi:uroporphyrinogen decarboxylase
MIALPRDLVLKALKHEETEFCPYVIWIKDTDLKTRLAKHYRVESVFDSVICNHIEFCGHIKAAVTSFQNDSYLDEFGSVLKIGIIPAILQPALPHPSLENYSFPILATDTHFIKVPGYLHQFPDRYRIVQLLELFFERAWNLRGMQEFLKDIITEPDFVGDLLDHLLEIMLECVDKTVQDYGIAVDAIGWTDDYGGQSNLLINPLTWRKIFKPRLAILCEHIRHSGKTVFFHSCGNIEAIIPDLIEIGVDILNPIQPETMDIFKLKREFGKDICFFGGLGTQHTLMNGTPEEVRTEVEIFLRELRKGGGFVIAPVKEIMPNVPFENAIALIDSLRLQNF